MKKNHFILCLLMAVGFWAACTKDDEYKMYTENGEALYTGKLDSVQIYAGRLRVQINGLLPADPKITKVKVTWNSGGDSAVFNITKGNGIERFSRIIPVQEGIQNFVIQNFDAAGNGSVKVNAIGTSYGPRYQNTLLNRPVVSAEFLPASGNTVITWDSFDTTSGAKGTIISFTKTNDTQDSVYVPVSQNPTTIPGLKIGTSVVIRTQYLPAPNMIDTFYAAAVTQSVKANLTTVYLSNTGPGFARATFDGRWGTLAAPWVTNAAAKNKGGINGGYSSDAGGVINWETWNNTPVVNGIIYQATSAALPVGNYTVIFDEYSEIQSNSSVYCVAAAGGSGIPVLANLSTALGSVALFNGANVGGTSPNVSDTRSFNFTLTTPQVVSIGFLGNIVGSGNPGSYFQVKKLQLFKN